jgi:hypothetical protein
MSGRSHGEAADSAELTPPRALRSSQVAPTVLAAFHDRRVSEQAGLMDPLEALSGPGTVVACVGPRRTWTIA